MKRVVKPALPWIFGVAVVLAINVAVAVTVTPSDVRAQNVDYKRVCASCNDPDPECPVCTGLCWECGDDPCCGWFGCKCEIN